MKRGSVILLVGFLGCEPHFESGKTLCSDKGECPGGFFCSNGVCVDNQLAGGSGGNGGAGGSAGSPSTSSTGTPATKGDACNSLGASFCPPFMACDPSYYASQSLCIQDFVSGCCVSTGTCAVSVYLNPSTFQQCEAALASMTCAEIVSVYTTGTVPSVCALL
jgi:hypothetical protein